MPHQSIQRVFGPQLETLTLRRLSKEDCGCIFGVYASMDETIFETLVEARGVYCPHKEHGEGLSLKIERVETER